MMGIYQITNTKNNKKYIGSSRHIFKRWEEHLTSLNYNMHHSYKLQEDWNKYSIEDYNFQVLQIVNDENKLLLIEQEWINSEESNDLFNVHMSTSHVSVEAPKELKENILYVKAIDIETKTKLRNNIVIYQKEGKLKGLGNNRGDLSKTWFNKNPEQVKQLKLNISNYLTNKTNVDSNSYAWTTFMPYFNKMYYRGNKKTFFPLNCDELLYNNKRNYLCFAANCFFNSFIKRKLADIEVTDDIYAISLMLKWIVNVSDISSPIHIYIPSLRMENLLRDWISRDD